MTNMREHFLRPYKVGAKKSKSLAVVIPQEIVQEYNIDTTTILYTKCSNKGISLYCLNHDDIENSLMHDGSDLQTYNHHTFITRGRN